MNAVPRCVYLDPHAESAGRAARDAGAPRLGRGEARLVRVSSRGELEPGERRVAIGPNAYHALDGFGVFARLDGIDRDAPALGPGREALLAPAQLDRAIAILYEADRDTYGGARDLCVARRDEPEPIEYRLRIDQRDYQRTLSRLIDLFREAHRHGHAVWMAL